MEQSGSEVLKAFCLCGSEIRITTFSKSEEVLNDRVYGWDHTKIVGLTTGTKTVVKNVAGICLKCGDVEIKVTTTTRERR